MKKLILKALATVAALIMGLSSSQVNVFAAENTPAHRYILMQYAGDDLETENELFNPVTLDVSTPTLQAGTVITVSGLVNIGDVDVVRFTQYQPLKNSSQIDASGYEGVTGYAEYMFGGSSGMPITNGTVSITLGNDSLVQIVFYDWEDSLGGGFYPGGYLNSDGSFVLYSNEHYPAGSYTQVAATYYPEIGEYDYKYFAVDQVTSSGNATQGGTTAVTNTVDVSAVYDQAFYAANNADLVAAGLTGDAFNLAAYKANNADLVEAFGDDNVAYYMHYINNGKAENRIAK